MWICQGVLNPKIPVTHDVTFKFQNASCTCEKAIFSSASSFFKQIFETRNSLPKTCFPPGVSVKEDLSPEKMMIHIEDTPEAFNTIHRYLHDPKIEVDELLLPGVCKLAKKLQCFDVYCVFTKKLENALSLKNIGETCSLVTLGYSGVVSSTCDEQSTSLLCLAAERELADATRNFLLCNADAVACSQTGQLSARLYVDIVSRSRVNSQSSPLSSSSIGEDCVDSACVTSNDLNYFPLVKYGMHKLNDIELAERVLKILLDRISDDGLSESKEIGRKFGKVARVSAKDTVTEEIRIKIRESQLNENRPTISSQFPLYPGPVIPSKSSCKTTDGNRDLQKTVTAETETCLIAKTTLSVGSISILLGKLNGSLVSLSLKRQPSLNCISPTSLSSSTTISKVLHQNVNTVVLPPSPPPSEGAEFNLCIQNGISSLSSLNICLNSEPPEPIPIANPDASPGHFFPDETFLNGRNCTVIRSFGYLDGKLFQARSAAGACNLSMTFSAEDFPSSASVLLAGGFTQNGCLNSVECLQFCNQTSTERFHKSTGSCSEELSTPESISDGILSFQATELSVISKPGPRLQQARGRLAMAITEHTSADSLIFACGGCDGSNDLASSECLSSSALQAWILCSSSKQNNIKSLSQESLCFNDELSQPKSIWKSISHLQQARSYAAATAIDRSQIAVLGGQFVGKPLSSVELHETSRDEWISLPSMMEARSQLCCTMIPDRNLILAVGGVSSIGQSNFFESSQTIYDPELCSLSATAEAYDHRCRGWIRLPDLINRSPLVGATILPMPSSGRVLLIGGSDGQSALAQTQIFDSRSWTWLIGPSLSIGRCSPCAVRLFFGIAVFGGYNVTDGGFLDSVEFIGSSSSASFPPHNPASSLVKGSPELAYL